MVADNNFTNGVAGSKAPPFEELNFKKFKKLFTSFLMRHNRAHLVLAKDKSRHIHDLDPLIPEAAPMTEAQANSSNTFNQHNHKMNSKLIWFRIFCISLDRYLGFLCIIFSLTLPSGNVMLERVPPRIVSVLSQMSMHLWTCLIKLPQSMWLPNRPNSVAIQSIVRPLKYSLRMEFLMKAQYISIGWKLHKYK